jgi:hypothetical protein
LQSNQRHTDLAPFLDDDTERAQNQISQQLLVEAGLYLVVGQLGDSSSQMLFAQFDGQSNLMEAKTQSTPNHQMMNNDDGD